ncbi:MAG: M20/M25/M40 family metallo-hydrolase [Microbacterium sp.]
MSPEQATDAAQAALPKAVARLREAVLIETPTSDAAASGRIADLLESWLSPHGTVRRVTSVHGEHLVADVPGTVDAQPILLVGHSDTVWPRGTADDALPWSIDGDTLRGPGVYDMKSGLVIIATALDALRAAPRRPVRILITCDEEIGSPSSRDLLLTCAQDVAGALAFESPHPDGALKVGRAGSTRLRLGIGGRSAHAALDPDGGVSAIDELVDQLLHVRRIVTDTPGTVLCNIGTIAGGTRANVIPEHAEAEIGLRFLDAETERSVLDRIRSAQPVRDGAEVRTAILSSRPAWAGSDADAALLQRIRVAGAALGQRIDARPAMGAGDENLLGAAGVPTVDGLGPSGGGAHALSEHISIRSLAERIALLSLLLSL